MFRRFLRHKIIRDKDLLLTFPKPPLFPRLLPRTSVGNVSFGFGVSVTAANLVPGGAAGVIAPPRGVSRPVGILLDAVAILPVNFSWKNFQKTYGRLFPPKSYIRQGQFGRFPGLTSSGGRSQLSRSGK